MRRSGGNSAKWLREASYEIVGLAKECLGFCLSLPKKTTARTR